jgi:acyl-CoA reductase-like NAD-dependent aldehyde dehydrogenase
VQAETGATLAMTQTAQIAGTTARIRRYARGALEPMDKVFVPSPNYGGPAGPASGLLNAMAVRQPVGVVAAITSYNVPLNNVMGKVGPALATGNCVVVKPAPQDPLGVIEMVKIFNEAGFPPGVISLVLGSSPEVGEALVASPGVTMVSFTGSSAVGAMINQAAAKDFKRVLMELGGKGATLVFEGADLRNAARHIASTWTYHAGQICTAPTRVIAQRSIYDALVEELAAVAQRVTVGDPLDPATVLGPVITKVHRERVMGYIESGLSEGATAVTGGGTPDRPGWFVEPTLLAGATNRMKVAREEIFGPVVVAQSWRDEDDIVARANDSLYGLAAGVWTSDLSGAYRFADRLEAGCVWVNTWFQQPFGQPLGGVKQSGYGRELCAETLLEYSAPKAISMRIDTERPKMWGDA